MRRKRYGRLSCRRPGQALVELAMTLPILLLLVLGVVEFARAWNLRQTLTDAAREGARLAAVANPNTTVDSVALAVNQSIFTAGFDSAAAVKTLPADPGGMNSNDLVVVTIEYPYTLRIIRGLMGWTGASAQITIRGGSRFRKE